MSEMTTNPTLAVPTPGEDVPRGERRSYWGNVRERLRHDPVTLFFMAVIVAAVGTAVLAPWVAPHDPYATSMLARLRPIGTEGHILGTDELGRDMLSRLIWGARTSLLMGILPVIIAVAIGGLLGVIAGFMGGAVNMIVMRTMDVFYAFPSVLLAVAI